MSKTNQLYLGVTILFAIFIIWGVLMKNNADTSQVTDTTTASSTVENATQPQAQASAPQAATTQQPTPTPMQPITKLMMKDEVVGTGAEAKAGDTVTVNYVGALTNGTIFDASKNHGDQGFTFTLGAGQVIKGWDEGVAGMKVGGKRQLAIPAALAYGDRAVGNVIPANSDLLFEVELLKIGK